MLVLLCAMHILSAEQFDRGGLEDLFEATEKIHFDYQKDRLKLAARHAGHQAIMLFYEPSTRTRVSFEMGAYKLGMSVSSTENAKEFSSAAKGETIEDTVQVLCEYEPDLLVIRHNEKGSVDRGATVSRVPILNAGDGAGEHPTQALLDSYTIHQNHHGIDGRHIVMGGDLKHGRTVRSLSKTLALFKDIHITFASIPELQMEDDVKEYLTTRGVSWDETDSLHEVASQGDVFYWTRLQDERFGPKPDDSEDVRQEKQRLLAHITNAFDDLTIDGSIVNSMKGSSSILHPLPRRGEIKPVVDSSPQAKYFAQAGNGMWVRMALMDNLLAA